MVVLFLNLVLFRFLFQFLIRSVFVPPVIVSFSVLGVAAYYAKISHEKESLVDKESIKCQNRAREALFACKAASSNSPKLDIECTREYESALREKCAR